MTTKGERRAQQARRWRYRMRVSGRAIKKVQAEREARVTKKGGKLNG